jgi:hypothetical protein
MCQHGLTRDEAFTAIRTVAKGSKHPLIESNGDANLALAIAMTSGCWMDNTFAILHWDGKYTIVMRRDK